MYNIFYVLSSAHYISEGMLEPNKVYHLEGSCTERKIFHLDKVLIDILYFVLFCCYL